jgi:hypothetical protein
MTLTQPAQSNANRKWKMRINTGTLSSEVWTEVLGVNELMLNPFEGNFEEDDVFDQSGYGSTTKTGLRWSATTTLIRQKTVPAGLLDVGQEQLRTHAMTLGSGGVACVQIYDRDGGDEAYQGFCEVKWAPDGGKETDLETIKIELYGKGAMVEIVNPDAGS